MNQNSQIPKSYDNANYKQINEYVELMGGNNPSYGCLSQNMSIG